MNSGAPPESRQWRTAAPGGKAAHRERLLPAACSLEAAIPIVTLPTRCGRSQYQVGHLKASYCHHPNRAFVRWRHRTRVDEPGCVGKASNRASMNSSFKYGSNSDDEAARVIVKPAARFEQFRILTAQLAVDVPIAL